MILVHSWNSIQTTFPTRALEWFFGVVMTNLGLVLWYNSGLFAAFPGPMRGLAEYAPQEWWSAICLLLGVLRLAALTVNGMWWRTPMVRCLMAFGSCFVWYRLTHGLVSNFGLTAAFMPACLAFDAYNAVRCGTKVGVAEFAHRLELRAEAKHGQHGRQQSSVA